MNNMLDFMKEMDEEKKREYKKFLKHIINTAGKSKFRVSNIGLCNEHRLPVIAGPIGYINKLEREGIVAREYSSNSRTEYVLAQDPEKLRKKLEDVV